MNPGLAVLLSLSLASPASPPAEVVDEAPASETVVEVEASAPALEIAPAEAPSAESPAPAEAPTPAPEDEVPTVAPEPSTHDVPADDFELESGLAPGGYYDHGTILERPPPDGQSHIVLGSILVPLGLLSTVTNALGAWASVPEHCVERMGALGFQLDDASNCSGMFTLNMVSLVQGSLMLVSGATILGIGLVRRQRYQQWRARHGMRAQLRPSISGDRRSISGGLRIRF